jgi:hypothetical protein
MARSGHPSARPSARRAEVGRAGAALVDGRVSVRIRASRYSGRRIVAAIT